MSESLLSFSEVLLFGRELNDLKLKQRSVRLAEELDSHTNLNDTFLKIDGVHVREDDRVLVQVGDAANEYSGIYKVVKTDDDKFKFDKRKKVSHDSFVYIRRGRQFKNTYWQQTANRHKDQLFIEQDGRRRGRGVNNFIGDQFGGDARLARIYGFAYDGTYYEMPEPTIFLVHGHGESATGGNLPYGFKLDKAGDDTTQQTARAPMNPSVSGVAAADYQMASDIRVWNYDQADYTIRMDIAAGQIEEVLLDVYFEYDAPMVSGAKVSGAKVSGAKVSGAKVSGAKVSGAKVSGAKVSGAKARGE
ncbi:MAG: pentapeptide repeat-containing protein [Ruegeria sp.]